MYTFDSRVRYSEVDHHQKMTLPAVINYFQDCSTFHSEDIGLGIEALEKRGKVWVLSSWQIVIDRYPKMGERIVVSTWPTGFDNLCGTRNFCMKDEKNEMVAYANSIWVFMDVNKGRPAKPCKEDVETYGVEPALEMYYAPRKIALPKEASERECFPVRRCHIDTNEHVNNCQYVQMALEVLDEEQKTERNIHQVRVEYKKSAVFGDIIQPKIASEQDRTVVELCRPDGKLYAAVEFKGEM